MVRMGTSESARGYRCSKFTLAWLLQGMTRADYDPARHPVSSLAIGELGWIQRATFLVTGVLMAEVELLL